MKAYKIESVLERLREGESLRKICRDEDMPARQTFLAWVEADNNLADQYARARQIGWDAMAEKNVDEAEIAEDAAKGRLAFDARRWYLGKMLPKKYGDRVMHSNDPEAPFGQLTDEQIAERFEALRAKS